ncbi:hypothetical protein CDAR_286331 [Caerostris darwini]|uniref:Odorant receptor n=1 Tax=Caerostris darwini TaxID=1538125 RepID=A0AAV4W2E8_9ARAC|nr:hypothetical protein CDAR_286331 [Caerostris darwini]
MISFRDIISLRSLNFLLIGALITSIQKFVFVLYIAVSIWNGSFYDTCDRLLMPNKPPTKWLSFFQNDLQDCDSLFRIFTKQHCITSIFMKDDSSVYAAALSNLKFSRWHYLVIVRTFKFLAPFTIQISFLMLPVLAALMQMAVIRKVLEFFGYHGIWQKATEGLHQLSTRTGLQRSKLYTFLCLFFGFLLSSVIVCFCTSSQQHLTECQTPMCLYCYPRLMHTIFKEQINIYPSGKRSMDFMFNFAKYLTTAIFSSFLYASTVVFLCMLAYIVSDACMSLYVTGQTASQYALSVPLRQTVAETWNQYFMPLKDVLSSPKATKSPKKSKSNSVK